MPDVERLRIRRAAEADLPELLPLLVRDMIRDTPEDLGPPLPDVYFEAFRAIDRDPNQLLLVAELDGRIAGSLQLTFTRYLTNRGGLVATIEAVRTAEALRGRGLGAKLMRWAIDEARRRGCIRVQLTTNKLRTDAHRFYARLGFVASHEGMKLWLA